MAYEWLFRGQDAYKTLKFEKKDGRVLPVAVEGVLSKAQMALSKELALRFPAYLNSLNLSDPQGRKLSLDDSGGSVTPEVNAQ